MTASPISRLRNPEGFFSMVAVDQRGSLRAMLREGNGGDVDDEELTAFKIDVAGALSPHASGMLVDVDYGYRPIVESGRLSTGCPLIVAVDEIDYSPEGATLATRVRPELLGEEWGAQVAGLKLLLLWTPAGWIGCTNEDVRDYVNACEAGGRESVLEVVVRDRDGGIPDDATQAQLLAAAAAELAAYHPTLYKTEVPFRAHADGDRIAAASREITETLDCPWVVLSSGVTADEFPGAVTATRRGGASGFLSGRAIWAAAARSPRPDRAALLAGDSVLALSKLVEAARLGGAA